MTDDFIKNHPGLKGKVLNTDDALPLAEDVVLAYDVVATQLDKQIVLQAWNDAMTQAHHTGGFDEAFCAFKDRLGL